MEKDYVNVWKAEVDKLLENTKLEMYETAQSGSRSPKSLNCPTSTIPLKPGSDSIHNTISSFPSLVKSKKRERNEQGVDHVKWERQDDGDSGQYRPGNMLKSEIDNITEKGGLMDVEGVEKLVQLMKTDSPERKIDLAGRIMLVHVITFTDKFDCLGRFVQLKGLPVLDGWLQEAYRGKIGHNFNPRENDKPVEEFLLALLRALDKLPVNLHALQTCNVGKSVNNLRNHKNSEIQKKARSLVDTWKKRVEAEMKTIDVKSGSGRGVSWSVKPVPAEVPYIENSRSGGPIEVGPKGSNLQASLHKSSISKPGLGEGVSKPSSAIRGLARSSSTSMATNTKDPSSKLIDSVGASDPSKTPIKEEKSSGSSQSQNNSHSCSGDHAKPASSFKEDARSSTAGSVNASKNSNGNSRIRRSNSGLPGSAVAGVPRDAGLGRGNMPNLSNSFEKTSPTGTAPERGADPLGDHGSSQRLIKRLPYTGGSPARSASGSSFEEATAAICRASPPRSERQEQGDGDRKVKVKTDAFQANAGMHLKVNSEAKDHIAAHVNDNQSREEQCRIASECEKAINNANLLTGNALNSGKSFGTSFSSMNALIESCAKFSEASALAPGDDVGMNLLASVAAGEISKSDASPVTSGGNSPLPVDSSANDIRSEQSAEYVACNRAQHNIEAPKSKNGLQQRSVPVSAKLPEGDKALSIPPSAELQQNAHCPSLTPDMKHGEHLTHPSRAFLPDNVVEEAKLGGEGASQFHDHRNLSAVQVRKDCIPGSAQKKNPKLAEDKNVDFVSEESTENGVCDAAAINVKVNAEAIEGSVCQTSKLVAELEGKSPAPLAEGHIESDEVKNENTVPLADSNNYLGTHYKADEAGIDVKAGRGVEQMENWRITDSPNIDCNLECPKDDGERKEVCSHFIGESVSCAESATVSRGAEMPHVASTSPSMASAAGSDVGVKLDFDLNEGFPIDDGSNSELLRSPVSGNSFSIQLSCPLPLNISSISASLPSSVTVASPAKGPFILPENLSRATGGLGWKGSAATSAFRPAEPRKVHEMHQNTADTSIHATSSKQSRSGLNIDLNVPDEEVREDMISPNSTQVTYPESVPHEHSSGGIDLDLNKVDESADVGGSLSISNRSSQNGLPLTGRFLNGGTYISRDFDLNDGPCVDEVGVEAAPNGQHSKNNVAFPSPIPGARLNSTELENFSSWFPPGNSYSTITIPSRLPSRAEQSYPIAAASSLQRFMATPASSASFSPEMYRGTTALPSPAVAYPPSVPLQYPGFPFETSFSLSSNSFSGCSSSYMDSTSGGVLCFPSMASPLVGPASLPSSQYARPYAVAGRPCGTSNISTENRKWGSHNLDLNAGPGCTDVERRDEKLPPGFRQLHVPVSQALADGQFKMYSVPGGVLKRKEPDGGWDTADNYGYKQAQWQ